MAALPGEYPITIRQNQPFRRVIVYKDSDGNSIDLTGYTAYLIVRRGKGGKLITEMESDDEITIDGEAGEITLERNATATAAMEYEHYGHYDLRLTPASGADDSFALLTGPFYVERDVEPEASDE